MAFLCACVEHKENKNRPALSAVKIKIRHWCAYQERSQNQTREKLRELGLSSEETEQLLADLVSENFINEERFALAFAGGRFRIKHWGRQRIRRELQRHKISEPLLRLALASIGEEEYNLCARKLVEKKIREKPGVDRAVLYRSIYSYLTGKGFESEKVSGILNQLMNEKK